MKKFLFLFFSLTLQTLQLQAQHSNITISTAASSGGTWANNGVFNSTQTFIPSSNNANVNVSEIQVKLRSWQSNVTINTACASCTQTGNVGVNDPISTYNENGIAYNKTLSILAGGNVTVTGSISLGYPFSTNVNGGNLSFLVTAAGNVLINGAISTKPMDYESSASTRTTSTEGSVKLTSNLGFVRVNAQINTSGGAASSYATLFTGSGGAISLTSKTGITVNAPLISKGRDQASSDGPIYITLESSVVTSGGGINDGITAPMNGGGFSKEGPGIINLSATNTNSGRFYISQGTIQLGSSTCIPDNVLVYFPDQGSTLDLNGFSETIGSLESGYGKGKVTSSVPGNVVLTIGEYQKGYYDSDPTFCGLIEDGLGVVGLTKVGTGIVSLGNAVYNSQNTYSGVTNINAGILTIFHGQSLGNTMGGTVVNGTGQLQPYNNITVAEELTLNTNGIGLYNLNGATVWTGLIKLLMNSKIKVETFTSLILSPTNGVAISGVDVSLSWDGGGPRTVNGAINLGTGGQSTNYGILTLTAASNYSGMTTILANSILNARQNTCMGNGLVYINISGCLQIQGGIRVSNELKMLGVGDANGAFRSISGDNFWDGPINNYLVDGQINVDANSLTINGNVTSTSNFLKVVAVGNLIVNGILTGTGKSKTWGTSPNQVTGLTSIVKEGSGMLKLAGSNTYTGSTVITQGLLQLGALEVISNTSNLLFNGGNLEDGGFSETLGDIYVLTNGKIRLGTAAHDWKVSRMMNVVSPAFLTLEAEEFNAPISGLTIFGAVATSSTHFLSPFGARQSTKEGGLGIFGNKLYSQVGNANAPIHFYVNSSFSDLLLGQIQFYNRGAVRYYTMAQKPVASGGVELLFSTPK